MKIYFAYRTGYQPNNRFIKEFEAESILAFFQTHWRTFTDNEQYREFLGIDVYGFPIHQYQEEVDEFVIPPKTNTLDELKECLERGVYCNDIIFDEHCIQVLTDDDEIELAWYVFDETYKNANMDKLALWFYENLPTQVNSNKDFELEVELPQIKVGDSDDCCYLIDNTIYDSANSEDITSIQILGTNLVDLMKNLKSVKFNDDNYDFNVLKLIQSISINENIDDTNKVLTEFVKYDLSQIGDFQNLSIKDNIDYNKVSVSNHIAELCVVSMGCFYNYYVLFDNKWANSYPELAKSLINFGINWQFIESDDDCDDD